MCQNKSIRDPVWWARLWCWAYFRWLSETRVFHYRTRANRIFSRKENFLFVHVYSNRNSQASLAKSAVTHHRLHEGKCGKHSHASKFPRVFKKIGEHMTQIFFARAYGAHREVKYNFAYWRAEMHASECLEKPFFLLVSVNSWSPKWKGGRSLKKRKIR